MKNKYLFLSLIFLNMLILSACWDKTEFTQVSFAVAMAIDEKDDNYEVTVKLMLPKEKDQGSDDAKVWLVSGSGASIYEAVENLNNRSPREAYWGHMSLIVLGESIEEDITGVLDYFSRAGEFRRSVYVVFADGNGAELLQASTEQSKVNAFYIYTLLRDMEMRYKNTAVDLNDCFLCSNYQGGGAYLLPIVGTAEPNSLQNTEQAPDIMGAVLIKDNRKSGRLDKESLEGYRFLKCRINQGAIVTDNPLGEGKLSFNIKKSKTKLSWQNDTLVITIKGTINLAEMMNAEGIIGEKNSEKKVLEETVNSYVQKKAQVCLDEAVAKNADFLHLGQWLNAYHHEAFKRYDGEDYLRRLNIEIKSDFTFKLSAITD